MKGDWLLELVLVAAAVALPFVGGRGLQLEAGAAVQVSSAAAEAEAGELPDLPAAVSESSAAGSVVWRLPAESSPAAAGDSRPLLRFHTADGWRCDPCETMKRRLMVAGIEVERVGEPAGSGVSVPRFRAPDGAQLVGLVEIATLQSWAETHGAALPSIVADAGPAEAVVSGSGAGGELAGVVEALRVHLERCGGDATKAGPDPVTVADWRPAFRVDVPDNVPAALQALLVKRSAVVGPLAFDWAGDARSVSLSNDGIKFSPAVVVRLGSGLVSADLQALEVSDNGRRVKLVLGRMVDLVVVLE